MNTFAETRPGLPDRIYLLSQAIRPAEVRAILVATALKDGWMPLVVNMNLSIFVGMIALTAGFGAIQSLVFLAIHLTLTTFAMVIYLVLQLRAQRAPSESGERTEQLLYFNDMLMMLGWGASLALFVAPLDETRSLMLVLLLSVAGIASAALNAKTLMNLMIGRFALFGPPAVFVAVAQPALWPLLLASLSVGAAISVGIGYAVHVQLLNESNLVLQSRDTAVLLEDTARQEADAQRQLLREARLREHFLHSVTHDLSQPLAGLDMCLYTLDQQDLAAPARGPVATARTCLSTAKSLIADVAQLAALQDGGPPAQLETVALGPLIEELGIELAPVAQSRGLDLRLVPSRARALADPQMVRRVLRNLAFNALDYTPRGRVLIGVRQRGSTLGIVVADTGAGIEPSRQASVFDAFQRGTEAAGEAPHLGLGLAIVDSLTRAMGGAVDLRSQPGRGTLVEIRLPRALGVAKLTSGPRILLAEDRPALRAALEARLAVLGCRVTAPATAEAMRTHTGAGLAAFDGCLLDFTLAPDLTAFDLLRAAAPEVWARVLVISDHADRIVQARIAAGGARFAAKPVTERALTGWLAALA